MNIKELKEAIAGIDDDIEVVLNCEYTYSVDADNSGVMRGDRNDVIISIDEWEDMQEWDEVFDANDYPLVFVIEGLD